MSDKHTWISAPKEGEWEEWQKQIPPRDGWTYVITGMPGFSADRSESGHWKEVLVLRYWYSRPDRVFGVYGYVYEATETEYVVRGTQPSFLGILEPVMLPSFNLCTGESGDMPFWSTLNEREFFRLAQRALRLSQGLGEYTDEEVEEEASYFRALEEALKNGE